MMKLQFETDNSAFESCGATESARILRAIANRIESGDLDGAVMDINGNRIGKWELR